MLVVLETLQEIVVLGKGLTAALGHIECALLHLLTPESHCLLSLIPHVCVNQLPQLLVTCDLSSILESQRLSQIIVHVFLGNCHSILIVHDQLSDLILIERFGGKGGFGGRLKTALASLIFLALLLILDGEFSLLEILSLS